MGLWGYQIVITYSLQQTTATYLKNLVTTRWISNTRIFRPKQRTWAWPVTVVHVPGKSIPAYDATSRNQAVTFSQPDTSKWLANSLLYNINSTHRKDQMEEGIIVASRSSLNNLKALTWRRIKKVTQCDPYVQQLKNWWISPICTNLPA